MDEKEGWNGRFIHISEQQSSDDCLIAETSRKEDEESKTITHKNRHQQGTALNFKSMHFIKRHHVSNLLPFSSLLANDLHETVYLLIREFHTE